MAAGTEQKTNDGMKIIGLKRDLGHPFSVCVPCICVCVCVVCVHVCVCVCVRMCVVINPAGYVLSQRSVPWSHAQTSFNKYYLKWTTSHTHTHMHDTFKHTQETH